LKIKIKRQIKLDYAKLGSQNEEMVTRITKCQKIKKRAAGNARRTQQQGTLPHMEAQLPSTPAAYED